MPSSSWVPHSYKSDMNPSLAEQLKLDTDEIILKQVRKHWFVLLAQTAGVIILAVVPIPLAVIGLSGTELLPGLALDPRELYGPAIFFLTAWLLVMWMTLFGIWTDYYLDNWIVTTRRVIAIDQQGFFRRKVASFRLERLQNVTIDIHGIIATFLNFGHITAETAGNTEAFVIRGIPDPRGVKALIQEHADEVIGSGRFPSGDSSSTI